MRKIIPILKIAANFIPALAVGASITSCVCLGVKSANIQNNAFDNLRQEPVVQELITRDKEVAQAKYDSGEMMYKDYEEHINYLGSEEFLKSMVDNSEELNIKYKDQFTLASKLQTACFWTILPMAISAVVSAILYCPLPNDIYDCSIASDIIRGELDTLGKYIEEDKEKKKIKQREKEMNEYREEIE